MKAIQHLIEIGKMVEEMMESCKATQIANEFNENAKVSARARFEDCKRIQDLIFIAIAELQKGKPEIYRGSWTKHEP